MKFSQAMAKLEENQKLKFKDQYGIIASLNEDGYLVLKHNGNTKSLDLLLKVASSQYLKADNWELAQESVDFMTALNNGGNIKPAEGDFEYTSSQAWLRILGNGCYLAGKPWVDYVNGKWHVE